MATTGAPTTSTTNTDGKFPAADMVDSIHKGSKKAQLDTLRRIANLALPVAGKTAKRESIDGTIQQELAHGETAKFFGELFSRSQEGEMTREELDKKLLNWVLKIPGMKEKYNDLPDDLKSYVDEFKDHDLTKEFVPTAGAMKFPPNYATAKKIDELKSMWEEQYKLDKGEKYPGVVEKNGDNVRYVEKVVFENWGETVRNTPAVTFIPKSIDGVQNIVKYAKKLNKKVRVCGYRHSWSNLFSDEGEILISALPLDIATELPGIKGNSAPGEGLLQLIQLVPDSISTDKETIQCKIGTATTTEQFREWCLSPLGGGERWTLPFSVIIVETTFGGTISAMCHGAGIRHQTLSDLVVEVEFVDPNGELRTVKDPELLKAASGALGLLGIVTAYTIRLNKMTYTSMRPVRVPIELAVPPPQEYIDASKRGDPKYHWIKQLIEQHSQVSLDEALDNFIRQAENDYYAEWFWFPLQREVWVNTWNNTGNKDDATNSPSDFEAFLEWLEEWFGQLLNEWPVWQLLEGDLQAKLSGFLTLLLFPDVKKEEPPITTQLINGLEFRRGIQNLQAWDMEWNIALPSRPGNDDKPDWRIAQKAWWDAILLMEANPSVVRITLEMRIMGGSDVFLAAQRGNNLGTVVIEVLTTLITPTDDWVKFCQKLVDSWLAYKNSSGTQLRSRPHWGKQWSYLKFPDANGKQMNATEWFRQVAFREEIPLFMDALKKIGGDDFTAEELRSRFANRYLESIFWGAPDPAGDIVRPNDLGGKRIGTKIKKWLKGCFS